MGIETFIIDLALMLTVATVVTLIFKKIRMPVVLGYIVVGFLISPQFNWFSTVIEEESIGLWADIGIIFLMFALGLEFSFKKIATVGGSAIITAMTVMCSMVGVGYILGLIMGWNHMNSLFLGGMLSMSSTMIILKAYEEYNLKNENFASIVLGALVVEDMGGIFMMVILTTVSVGRESSGTDIFLNIGKLMAFLVIWVVVGIYIIPSFLKFVSKFLNDELLLVFSLAICFLMVVIGVKIGFSSALGAFLAGSILAGTSSSEEIEKLVKPFKDLFGAVFFISVGMMLVPSMVVKYIVPIIIVTLVTIFGQMAFSTLGILFSGQSLHTAVRGGFSMVQIGEFSFIVAALGESLKVTGDFLYPVVVCVSVITSFLTPAFINSSEKAYSVIDRVLPAKVKDFLNKYTSDDRSGGEKDEDWKNYLIAYFRRTLFCTAGLSALSLLGSRFLKPALLKYSEGTGFLIALTVVICFAMIPVIAVMCSNKNVLFTKLWIKNGTNKLPLTALAGLRILISISAVVITVEKILHLPYWIVFLLSFAVFVFAVKTEFVKSMAIRMEMRFVGNMNEKYLAVQRKSRGEGKNSKWLDEKMFVISFRILNDFEDNSIIKFAENRFFHVTIIRIVRGEDIIVMPGPDEKLIKGDVVSVLGTKEEIEECVLMFEKEEFAEVEGSEPLTLKAFIYRQIFDRTPPDEQLMCVPVFVVDDSVLNKKQIKYSGFRQLYHGYIIGIERGNIDIVNPDINTLIEERDLLWAVGGQDLADSLLQAGLWDNEEKAHIRREIKEERSNSK